MPERVHRCPNCGATLTPSRFARAATCGYCEAVVELDEEAVTTALFRAAHERLHAHSAEDPRRSFTLQGERWLLGPLLAHGEIADVHFAQRLRPPTERALVKLLRDPQDSPMLAAEWASLQQLWAHAASDEATGALIARAPGPIAHGVVGEGAHAGVHATVLRYAPRFDHTLEAVRAALPNGVEPQIGVWMWRRILEVLSLLHRAGVVHGAVLPPHLLVERGEHGIRLVGYGCSGKPGAPLAAILARHERLYPEAQLTEPTLTFAHDLAQSARSVRDVLGADPKGRLPDGTPKPLTTLLDAVARGDYRSDARALWTEVGALARSTFGPPSFHPLVLPGDHVIHRTK